MPVRRSRRLLVLLAALISAAVVVAVAVAAVTRQTYAEGDNLSYRFERIVSDAGGFDSGWHIHPGLVVVSVQAGSLQFYQGSCTPKAFGPGETIIEAPWQPVRVVTTGSAAWTVTLFIPTGNEFSIPLARYSPQTPNPCP